jgi:hypothetical protein
MGAGMMPAAMPMQAMQPMVMRGMSGIEPVMPTQRITRAQLQQLMQFGGFAEMPAEYMMPAPIVAAPEFLAPGLMFDDPDAPVVAPELAEDEAPPSDGQDTHPGEDDAPQERSEEVAEIAANVVALLVNNLIEDERLPIAVRKWIKDVSPALQKLAEQDAEFLSNNKHAARRMLDEIMARSMTFASEESTGFAEFFDPVKEVAQPLAEHEAPDADLFERALAVMQAGWVLYEEQQKEAQERVVKASIRRDQRGQLAQKMSLALMRREEMNNAPIFVKQFVAGTWAQVVADAKLDAVIDFGPQDTEQDNARLQATLQAMADLAWSANPEQAGINKPRLLKLIPGLLKFLRDGLAAIEQSETQHAGFFDELMKSHEKALKMAAKSGATPPPTSPAPLAADGFGEIMGSGFMDSIPDLFDAPDETASAPAAIPASPATFAASSPLPSSSPAPVSAPAHAHSTPAAMRSAQPEPELHDTRPIAKRLRIGNWVEFSNEANPLPTRAQVTWMSPQATMFMFTAPKGQATSMTRRALDKLVEAGKFRIVNGESMVSGALQAVVQKALREGS